MGPPRSRSESRWLVLAALLSSAVTAGTRAVAQVPRVVGSFDSTVSGGTSLAGGGTLVNGARMALLTSFPNVTLSPTAVITPSYLETVGHARSVPCPLAWEAWGRQVVIWT